MQSICDLADKIEVLKKEIAAEAGKGDTKSKKMLELCIKLDKLFEEYISLKIPKA